MLLIHTSWLDLKPNRINGSKECFEDYYSRIKLTDEYKHIPEVVLKQWIRQHHEKYETQKNYGWIDYRDVEFELTEWDFGMLRDLYVIKNFRQLVKDIGSYNAISQFRCTEPDKEIWKEKGTWKTPPIVLNVDHFFAKKPIWSELESPYQLVEGHSRLGYLLSMKNISDAGHVKLAEKHLIYLMRKRGSTK